MHPLLLTALALTGFAANSILCRLALRDGLIDAASFTTLRLWSGALALWLLLAVLPARREGGATRPRWQPPHGDILGALALFAYAIAFALAYRALSAGTGALLLFGAVQLTMLGAGFLRGERLDARQWFGVLLAVGGLGYLLSPGLAAPPLDAAALMIAAGVAWGAYSLRGRGSVAPLVDTCGNFLLAAPFALGVTLAFPPAAEPQPLGMVYAAASGALASGLGYALWYAALPSLRAAQAATVQLAVPALAAFGGVLLLGEALTARLLLASVVTLGGIALSLRPRGPLLDPREL